MSVPTFLDNDHSDEPTLIEGRQNWYAIRVRPRCEKVVAAGLHEKQYEEFLPLYRKRTRWSDRMKEIELPLFTGYVFCRADLSGKPLLTTTPGVIGLLKFSGVPAVVSDREIEAIRVALHSKSNVEPWPYLREGQCVLVERGPLTGLRGLLVRTKGNWRVVLSVDALCRSIAVETDRDSITPVTPIAERNLQFKAKLSPSQWAAVQ